MDPGVKRARPLADYKLQFVFEDGQRRIFDVTPWLTRGAFRELRDEAVFRTVRVSFDTVEWANGCDLCPELLHAESHAVPRNLTKRQPAANVMAAAEGRVRYGTARSRRSLVRPSSSPP